ncbi:MAG: ubiquinol-cytochrome c reductase iron-sulfur subunit [Dehalococcoidia bacterium]|nr:ubiquinol-cytochrome c reductase iron-sulfur subunit [Dehalococcoidia bacterium]
MGKGISRRQFLRRAWWGVTGLLAIEMGVGLVASLWPKVKEGSFGTKVSVGSVDEIRAIPIGTVVYHKEARFYLSRVGAGFLALYRRCTHLGCVVPWEANDPSEDDLAALGRLNCPCHGSLFDRYGLVHGGPAPRPLDIFPISVADGEVFVDTGKIVERSTFDESQVTEV